MMINSKWRGAYGGIIVRDRGTFRGKDSFWLVAHNLLNSSAVVRDKIDHQVAVSYRPSFALIVSVPSRNNYLMALTVNQRRWLSYLVPLLIIAGMAYLNYASCYWFGYREIYRKHNKAVAISLWAFLAVCQLLVYIYWVVILVVGPGKTPQILPYDLYGTGDYIQYSKPPPYFFCDENGYLNGVVIVELSKALGPTI